MAPRGPTRRPVHFNLHVSSPVTHTCGQPVIFLLYGISSPGEKTERLPEPSPVWLPRLVQGSFMVVRSPQDPVASPCPAVSLQVLRIGCPLSGALPSFLPQQPPSLSLLKPSLLFPRAGGKVALVVGSFIAKLWWAREESSVNKQVCCACRLSAPGTLSLYLTGSRTHVPKRSGHESLP